MKAADALRAIIEAMTFEEMADPEVLTVMSEHLQNHGCCVAIDDAMLRSIALGYTDPKEPCTDLEEPE